MIEVKELCQSYLTKKIFENVHFQINKGEVVALVGRNGIGKSTFLLTLVGLLPAKSGAVLFNGTNIKSTKSWKQAVSYLPEKFQLYPNMTVYENLIFFARQLKIIEEDVHSCLELTGMENAKNEYVKNLSKGMLQRVGISVALLGDPELLILDEPTSGIDPNGREVIYGIIHKLGSMGKTVLFSSHHLEDIKQITTHVIELKETGMNKVSAQAYYRSE
jgi:ABC-2 type transport system ATP-binding protein